MVILSHSHLFSAAKEFCKVLFPYEAQNEDELSIKEGDIVVIITKVSVRPSLGAVPYDP